MDQEKNKTGMEILREWESQNTCTICWRVGHRWVDCPVIERAARELAEAIDRDIMEQYKRSFGVNGND